MHSWPRLITSVVLFAFILSGGTTAPAQTPADTIALESLDGLAMTADVYRAESKTESPWILLCHQAGWSRGEYAEIAPKLNKRGFNCLAIDQRSGGDVNGVQNQTALAARAAGKPTDFMDAEQDIVAALKYLRGTYPGSKVVLWGSSYSSSLALRIAGEHAELVDAVLAFAPGEYFQRSAKPANWIQTSSAKIEAPVLVTSARNEYSRWKPIFDAIPSQAKTKFVPQTAGNHGSRALWDRFEDSSDYWDAVDRFLESL